MSKPNQAPMKTFHVVFGVHRNVETGTISDPMGDYFVEAESAQVVRYALEQVLQGKNPDKNPNTWEIDVEEIIPLGLCDFIIDVGEAHNG